ncbi:MAG TPA: Trm112 family protein [Longimicrobiaceae bacterium]|jgi:uncharacterized protein YbaR (Trm112 family)|nr:Trm112 family protein [Longimicrobiaceae bacterium]
MEQWLLDLLVCPKCKGDLVHEEEPEALVCENCRLRYEVRDGVPILLIDEASPL